MRSRETENAACWVVVMLGFIFLGIMHLVLPNTGGSGADLPQALLVWCAILVLVSGCAWILCCQKLQFTLCSRMLAVAVVLMTLPLFWSPFRDWQIDALPRLAGLWSGLILYILLVNCHFTARQKQVILWFIAGAAVMQTLYTLAGLSFPSLLPETGQNALRLHPGIALGVFQQRNVTASFIATGAAVLLWLLGDSRYRLTNPVRELWRLWGISITVVLLFMTLTLLSSRTGWLGGLIIWLALTLIFWRTEDCAAVSRWGVRLAPATGIALGAALLPGGMVNALQAHDTSNLDRILILQQTWQMIVQHPLVGWGYGGFTWSFAHFLADRPVPLSRGMNELTHPHNELLFWWVEGGIVALVGLFMAVAAVSMRLLRRPNRYRLAVLACMLPILVHTQLEYPLYQSPVHWLLILLLLSFADAPATLAPPCHNVFRRTPVRFFPCLMVTLGCSGALLTAVTFWQGHYLTGFQQSPQRYAGQVLRLNETGIGTERLRKDQMLSYIVRYQTSGNVENLQHFSAMARRWLATWCDADIYHNLINVERYLGNEKLALQLKDEAHRLYPEDPRFSS